MAKFSANCIIIKSKAVSPQDPSRHHIMVVSLIPVSQLCTLSLEHEI